MTNCPWESLDEINDIESLGNVRQHMANGLLTGEEAVEVMRRTSRDNARTPMQWDDSDCAGFTTGKPWLKINPNYQSVNAAEELKRDDSVFHYYQKLISLRKQLDVIVDGTYELLEQDDPDLFVYTRTLGTEKLLVVCNFAGRQRSFRVPEEFAGGEILISNNERKSAADAVVEPYESFVVRASGQAG